MVLFACWTLLCRVAILSAVDLNYRIQKHFALDFTDMRYMMQGLDGAASQSAYPSANVGSVGARIFF